MAKIAAGISKVAGIVATIAQFIPGGQVIAAAASAVSMISGTIAGVLQKPPGAKGTVSQVIIGNNLPIPYAVGRTFVGGSQIYDNSAGENNKYRFNVNVITAAGPIDSFQQLLADFAPLTLSNVNGEDTGYYTNFLWTDKRLGARPETAFVDPKAPMPNWPSSAKTSGFATYKVTMRFDKDAKRYSGGIPVFGWVGKWVKLYDPRKDSTYPGGSGAHRWNDEATWEWSENPALGALSYARGRYIEKDAAGNPLATPVKLLGMGLRDRPGSIDMAAFVELANLCDARGWKMGGVVSEGPGTSKWENLKRFLQAAAAQPVWTGGTLTLRISAPRPSLTTITPEDLADEGIEVRAMKPFRERLNTIVPRYRSEQHRWEYIQAAPVAVSTYLAEDGESRTEERQYDLVQDKDHAARLAAYELVNLREFGPVSLVCKPRLLRFRPGECVTLDIPEAGLVAQKAIITGRSVDPASGKVTLTLESETDAKHAFALAQTGTAPPTPTIRVPGEVDEVVGDANGITADVTQLIANSYVTGLTFSVSALGVVTISNHQRVYADRTVNVTGGSFTVSGAASGDLILIFYDDPLREGGAVTYQYLRLPGGVGETDSAAPSPANPHRHTVGAKLVPATGSSGGGSGAGSGGGGWGWSRELSSL